MAWTLVCTNPDGVPNVECEYNGVNPDELAADLTHAGFSSVRVVEAIEETQHAHGWPLGVLGCLLCKGGEPTPVLVCPIARRSPPGSPPPRRRWPSSQAQPAVDTKTEPQAQAAEVTEPSRRLPMRWFQERGVTADQLDCTKCLPPVAAARDRDQQARSSASTRGAPATRAKT
jgi:hypothetical protein